MHWKPPQPGAVRARRGAVFVVVTAAKRGFRVVTLSELEALRGATSATPPGC